MILEKKSAIVVVEVEVVVVRNREATSHSLTLTFALIHSRPLPCFNNEENHFPNRQTNNNIGKQTIIYKRRKERT